MTPTRSARSNSASSIRSHADLAGYDPDLCVIKLGSAVLTTAVGRLDQLVLGSIARFAASRIERGKATLIVSSGAVAAGIGQMGLKERPSRVPELQALAAVGQNRLMNRWAAAFDAEGHNVAQVLVSADDFRDRRRYLNMRYTFEKLFEMGVVPILNENDTVTIDELRFGDNDGLAQLVGIKMLAGLLVFLTSVGGVYRHMPVAGEKPELVEVIERVTPEILAMVSSEKTKVGTGGMGSKLEAARLASSAGIPVIIAPGKKTGILSDLLAGKGGGTLILPAQGAFSDHRYSRRQRFIAFNRVKPQGRLWVDDGAVRALLQGHKSLLPAGVRRSEGDYERQDLIEIMTPKGEAVARGLTNYSAAEVQRLMGHRSTDIGAILGTNDYYDEVIHRDNLVVLNG
jgi:glutamate 5-kinase